MGRHASITYDEFLAAVYGLEEQGENITQAKIQAILKKGSANTVNKFYRQWKTENIQKAALPVITTDRASSQFREIWEKLNKETLQQLEEAKAGFDGQLSKLQSENEHLMKTNTELQALIEEFKAKNSHLKADYQLLNDKWIEEAKQRKALEAQKFEIEKNYNDYRNNITQSFNESKNAFEKSIGQMNQWSQSTEETFKHSLSELKEINEKQRQQFIVKLDSLEVARAKLDEINKKSLADVAKYKAMIENLEEQIRILEVKIITIEGELNSAHKLIQEKESTIANIEKKLAIQSESLLNVNFQEGIKTQLEALNTRIINQINK